MITLSPELWLQISTYFCWSDCVALEEMGLINLPYLPNFIPSWQRLICCVCQAAIAEEVYNIDNFSAHDELAWYIECNCDSDELERDPSFSNEDIIIDIIGYTMHFALKNCVVKRPNGCVFCANKEILQLTCHDHKWQDGIKHLLTVASIDADKAMELESKDSWWPTFRDNVHRFTCSFCGNLLDEHSPHPCEGWLSRHTYFMGLDNEDKLRKWKEDHKQHRDNSRNNCPFPKAECGNCKRCCLDEDCYVNSHGFRGKNAAVLNYMDHRCKLPDSFFELIISDD